MSGMLQMPIPQGLLREGNINVHDRPRVPNPDGSISTVRSASFTLSPEVAQRYGVPPNTAVLLPTVMWNPGHQGGRIVNAHEAYLHFLQTGENLGFFKDNQSADAYSQALHEQQAQEYNPHPAGSSSDTPFVRQEAPA